MISGTALTTEQATVLQLALDGASLFIGGKAGTGKSFLLRHIAHALSARGLSVSVSASTGIAALNVEGNTFHSTFGVPVTTSDSTSHPCHVVANQNRVDSDDALLGEEEVDDAGDFDALDHPHSAIHFSVERLIGLQVLLIDEVSLLHAGYLEALERCCRRVPDNNSHKPFGGVQVILSGDFLQLSPFDSGSASLQGCHGHTREAARSPTERYTCTGVWKGPIFVDVEDMEDMEDVSEEIDTTSENAEAAGVAVSELADTVSPSQLALKGYDGQHRTARRPMRLSWYRTKPLYASYVFQHCLVHVQLLVASRQRADRLFLAELNLLRVGQMPWRLARSAYVNPPDDLAIRLFPTNASVKNYNARRMLDLPGAPLHFKSNLVLSAVKRLRPHDNRARAASPATRGSPDRCLSEPIALALAREPMALSAHRRPFSFKDAETVLTTLLATVPTVGSAPPPSIKHVVVLPATYQDTARFGRMVVRLESDTLAQAHAWRDALEQAAQHQIVSRAAVEWESAVHQTNVMQRVSLRAAAHRRRRRSGGDGPAAWKLIRVNDMSASQVLALSRPSLQAQFASFRKTDPLLSDKELKVGCRVMLLRNLTDSLVNGSLGTVERFATVADAATFLPELSHLKVALSACMLRAEPKGGSRATALTRVPIVRMDHTGGLVAIPWINVPIPGSPHAGFFRSQVECMPLTPAYAFTVHKTQGLTFDQPVLFDGEYMFPCDHLIYVAASRVRCFSHLRLINVSPRAVTVHKPSLYFCEHLPDVRAAVSRWAAWKANGKSSLSNLFTPNWK